MHDDTQPVLLFFCVCTGVQLDQLVIDSAMEKREMEHKHATIQQRVSSSVFWIGLIMYYCEMGLCFNDLKSPDKLLIICLLLKFLCDKGFSHFGWVQTIHMHFDAEESSLALILWN